jgi:hypothetical protein
MHHGIPAKTQIELLWTTAQNTSAGINPKMIARRKARIGVNWTSLPYTEPISSRNDIRLCLSNTEFPVTASFAALQETMLARSAMSDIASAIGNSQRKLGRA